MADAGPAGSELVVRVKMIDGREIEVEVDRAGRIADVAEKVLEAEDAPMHKMIRLIYGGRLLQPEDPIAAHNIGPHVVIHAVISDAPFHVQSSGAHGDAAAHGSHPPAGAAEPPRRPRPAMQWGAGGAQAGNDAEGLLLKLPPGILLVLMWYVYLMHGTDLFSWFSTLSLVVLTLLYLSYALPGYAQGPVSLLDDALTGLFHYINPPPPGSHAHHD
eukprot:Tamp_24029.p1 GENE.Tamp_24029~~Tamp_24029.p1  ORF type:complete len:235 (+),score=37.30 Tamp_24029:60-707(+)